MLRIPFAHPLRLQSYNSVSWNNLLSVECWLRVKLILNRLVISCLAPHFKLDGNLPLNGTEKKTDRLQFKSHLFYTVA